MWFLLYVWFAIKKVFATKTLIPKWNFGLLFPSIAQAPTHTTVAYGADYNAIMLLSLLAYRRGHKTYVADLILKNVS